MMKHPEVWGGSSQEEGEGEGEGEGEEEGGDWRGRKMQECRGGK